MITESLAHPALPSTTNLDARDRRALDLYRERGDEILPLGEGVFEVPSCTGRKVYRVRYGGEVEACECPDFQFGHVCKHLLAVGIMHAARRFGVREVRSVRVAAGDGIAYRGKAGASRNSCHCYGGYHYITTEEDGEEHAEVVPCRRCGGSGVLKS